MSFANQVSLLNKLEDWVKGWVVFGCVPVFVAMEIFALFARIDVSLRISSWMTHVACTAKASWIGVGIHLIMNNPFRESYSHRESKSSSQREFLVRQTEKYCDGQGIATGEEWANATNL